MSDLTPEHKLLCDVAAVKAHLDKYSRIDQRALLGRVMDHLNAVVADQKSALCAKDTPANLASVGERGALDPAQEARNLSAILKYMETTSARRFDPSHVVTLISLVQMRLDRAALSQWDDL